MVIFMRYALRQRSIPLEAVAADADVRVAGAIRSTAVVGGCALAANSNNGRCLLSLLFGIAINLDQAIGTAGCCGVAQPPTLRTNATLSLAGAPAAPIDRHRARRIGNTARQRDGGH
jgi:hypothetical protein